MTTYYLLMLFLLRILEKKRLVEMTSRWDKGVVISRKKKTLQ